MRSSGDMPKSAHQPSGGVGFTAKVMPTGFTDDRTPTQICSIYKEGPYNGFRVSSLADRFGVCCNVCARVGANAAALSSSGK
jgi:hypothetical protein